MRKAIFWLHLGTGVVAGLVILMMSVTGVLLTYERQLIEWSDRAYWQEPQAGQERQSLTILLEAARRHAPEVTASGISLSADPAAPAIVSLGRGRDVYLQPYTGEVLGEGSQGMRRFFGVVTAWHRWFNAGPESRNSMRAITGACNLAFLFLILSGLYLWLPRIVRWPMFRARLLFARSYKTSKGRDFNWHHVFGFWSAIPLVLVVASGVVISYPWASDLLYRSVGEEPPRGGPGGAGGPGGPRERGGPGGPVASTLESSATTEAPPDFDRLYSRAMTQVPEWRTISMRLPFAGSAASVGFSIDQGSGGQPQRRHQLTLDARTGEVVSWEPFATQSAGRKLRTYFRFLHTGEALGVAGQTIAGLVSFASVMLVWTGFALAWRRLIQPLFRKGKSSAARTG